MSSSPPHLAPPSVELTALICFKERPKLEAKPEMWWSMPRGVCSLGSCTQGVGGWLGFPSPPRAGVEEPERNTVLENGWSQFSTVIYLLLPLLTPCLKVKPRKIIIGLWDVSNCVFHPLWFYRERKWDPGRTRRLPKASQVISSWSFVPGIQFSHLLNKETWSFKGLSIFESLLFLSVGMTRR